MKEKSISELEAQIKEIKEVIKAKKLNFGELKEYQGFKVGDIYYDSVYGSKEYKIIEVISINQITEFKLVMEIKESFGDRISKKIIKSSTTGSYKGDFQYYRRSYFRNKEETINFIKEQTKKYEESIKDYKLKLKWLKELNNGTTN